jgi:hypothetical protein
MDQHQKGRREAKHGFPIGSADRAEKDLPISRYKEAARRSCGGGWLVDPIGTRLVGDFGSFGSQYTRDREICYLER